MIILIDFDDVIFNTKKFKEDLIKLFLSWGVSEDIYERTYYESSDNRAVKTYDPLKQISRLCEYVDIDENKLIDSVNIFLNSLDKYLFSDVADFLKSFEYEDVYVVSYGDLFFQKKKINGSGIGSSQINIALTDKLKADIIGDILQKTNREKKQKIILIDDRNEQIRDVKEMFPEIATILLKRPEGRYQEMKKDVWCDYEAHDLKEAEDIIRKS